MVMGLALWTLGALAAVAVLLDRVLGEPARWHPLVGFGRLAGGIERILNRGSALRRRVAGLLAVGVLVAGPAVLVALLLWHLPLWASLCGHVLLLTFALGARSLHQHLRPIAQALHRGDLAAARALTARIVSRDTESANASELAKAAVESGLENGNDAIFGALFWFVVAGGPGALAFRLINTLDAMWGYRSARFLCFGWAAARLDDGLNWCPARLTALSYALLGRTRRAWRCWRRQAPQWDSPNAGPVMAAGAGALSLALGRGASYGGQWAERPPLGQGRLAQPADIHRALQLVDRSLLLWLCTLNAAGVLLYGTTGA